MTAAVLSGDGERALFATNAANLIGPEFAGPQPREP